MSFQSTISFVHNGEKYLTVTSGPSEFAHDMVISSICSLIALLDMGDHKFDDDLIDNLQARIEAYRKK